MDASVLTNLLCGSPLVSVLSKETVSDNPEASVVLWSTMTLHGMDLLMATGAKPPAGW